MEYEPSEIAQHNDDARGYWLSIDGVVYDVTEFLSAHPGGEPILRMYAGRDASHGFGRAHADRRRVALQLARCRIGVLRPLACALEPEHAAHQPAQRALHAALQLVVEMQNALTIDHGFQLEPEVGGSGYAPGRPGRYELQRGVETHVRFQREYLDVLSGSCFTQLVESLTPEQPAGVSAQRQSLWRSGERVSTRALELFQHLEQVSEQQLAMKLACFAVLDTWLLRMWKHELSRGLRVFERPHAASLRPGDRRALSGLCDRLLGRLGEYYQCATAL